MGAGVIRLDPQRSLKMNNGLVRAIGSFRQRDTLVMLRQIVSIGHIHGVLEERAAVVPVSGLHLGERRATRAGGGGEGRSPALGRPLAMTTAARIVSSFGSD